MYYLPELVIVAAGFFVLISDLFMPKHHRKYLPPLSLGAAAIAIGLLLANVNVAAEYLGGRFVISPLTTWFKIIFLLGGAFTVLLTWNSKRFERITAPGEFFSILLFTQVGMMCLISSTDLASLYISLELSTIPLFALAAWKRGDKYSGEAGIKYVLYGALASALLLYGFGLLYASSGSLDLRVVGDTFTATPLAWIALALVISGVGFKLTLTPFHFWAADVYQGAPTPVTAYLSVASKAAGLAFMFQIFFGMFGAQLAEWQWLIAALATASMTVGNLIAIIQRNIKRFMAFSSISQAGYLIMGFIGPYPEGAPAMLFYMLIFAFTNMAVFGVIMWYDDETGRTDINDYHGLSKTNPVLALVMLLALFSLAGVPPMAGFVGKFFLFSIAAKAGMHWLVAVAAINSTISLFYYLRIVRAMYIETPTEGQRRLPVSPVMQTTLAVTTAGVIFLGVIPLFYNLIERHLTDWLRWFAGW